jgi:2',3'-cyclic-nucleotide 2'-phosphodiesterase (5'-nucleotidase family)
MTGAAPGFHPTRPNPAGGADRLWLLGPGGAVAPPARVGAPADTLRLFHVNDIHAHFCDLGPDGDATPRFGRLAAHVARARAAAGASEAVLFLSAGDDHVGTIFDELLGWSRDAFVADAAYRLLSAAGLDAAAIGNHDLDRGAEILACGAAEAAFPLLSANIAGCPAAPAALFEAKGLRVGVIGLTSHTDTRAGAGIALSDPEGALDAFARRLAPHADILVALSHCGLPRDREMARGLAARAGKPTLIVGAHTHHVLNARGLEPGNVVEKTAIVQAGCRAEWLGEAVIARAAGVAGARLIHRDACPDAMPGDATLAPLLGALARRLADPICEIEGDAAAGPAVAAERYRGECALANLLTDAIVARSGGGFPPVDIALINATYLADGLGPGRATLRDLCAAAPYAETIWLAEATGAEVLAILRSNATRVLRPEEPAPPLGAFCHRGFLHASGRLSYGIDLAGGDVLDPRIDGAPLADRADETFALALTTYLALGGFKEGWAGRDFAGAPCPDLTRTRPADTGAVHRAEIAAHLGALGRVRPGLDGRVWVRGA